jgi:catechol 2,3-dioxygenase-like lactoylglutathione lyase family enzyme
MRVEIPAVKLKVSDLQRALDFYVERLGMTEGTKYNELEWEVKPHTGATTNLVLYCDPLGEHPYDFGPSWLTLQVEDVDVAASRLRDGGAEVGDVMEVPDHGVAIVMATDLDGNLLELVAMTG